VTRAAVAEVENDADEIAIVRDRLAGSRDVGSPNSRRSTRLAWR
jgi:hypothetical protein